jgi:hypothetical protein
MTEQGAASFAVFFRVCSHDLQVIFFPAVGGKLYLTGDGSGEQPRRPVGGGFCLNWRGQAHVLVHDLR